jgi:hypothetical protein
VFATKSSCRLCGAQKPTPVAGAKVPDWFCSCGYQNFGTRPVCHKCSAVKPENPTYAQPGQPQLQDRQSYQQSSYNNNNNNNSNNNNGDNNNSNNNNNNSNNSNNNNDRHQYNHNPSYQQPFRSEVRPGDWFCSCGFNNYSQRIDCLKCKSPKPMQQEHQQEQQHQHPQEHQQQQQQQQ